MWLILEVALGVLIGLLLYRGLTSFTEKRGVTIPVAIFALGFATILTTAWFGVILGALALLYLKFTDAHGLHESLRGELMSVEIICLLIVGGFVGWDLYKGHSRYKILAQSARCEKCESVGLRYKGIENGRSQEWGPKYDRPMGICQKCGHKQEL